MFKKGHSLAEFINKDQNMKPLLFLHNPRTATCRFYTIHYTSLGSALQGKNVRRLPKGDIFSSNEHLSVIHRGVKESQFYKCGCKDDFSPQHHSQYLSAIFTGVRCFVPVHLLTRSTYGTSVSREFRPQLSR